MDEINWQTLGQAFQQQDCRDDRTFVEWSNCLLEWQVKKVPLPTDFEVVLRYKLARYGMGKIFSDGAANEIRFDWTSAVDRVTELFRGIRMGSIEDMEEHFNEEFVLRLRLILDELQNLVEVEELQVIPLREMEFCLAVFLLVLSGEAKYEIFKLVLLPTDVLKFLRAVVSSMQRKKSCNDKYRDTILEEDSQQFCKLKICHRNVESLYNLDQIVENISGLTNVPHCLASLMLIRLENVSFSIPSANRIYEKIVRICRYSEENLVNADNQWLVKLLMLKTLTALELFVCISQRYQDFISVMRNCCCFKQIKQLCRYIASAEQLSEYHAKLYFQVSDFYSKLFDHVGTSAMSQNLADKVKAIKHLQKSCISFTRLNLSNIVNLVECNVDVTKVQQLFQQEIDNGVDKCTVSSIHNLWNRLTEETKFIKYCYSLEPSFVMTSWNPTLQELSESIRSILNNFHCSSLSDLSVNYTSIPQHSTMNLRHLLVKYFEELNKSFFLEDDQSLLKRGHQIFYGQGFLNCLIGAHPKYEVFVANSTKVVSILSLLVSEGQLDALVKRTLFQHINKLQDIRADGLKWVQIQDSLRNALLNVDENVSEELINRGAYPSFDLLHCSVDNCNDLKNMLAKQLYNKLYPSNCNTVSIAKVTKKQMATKDFKSRLALVGRNFDEAFELSGKNINSLNPTFFSWEPLLETLSRTENMAHVWKLETFPKIVQKLINAANVRSVTFLLTSLEKLFEYNIKNDYSAHIRVLRTLRIKIWESVIQTALVNRLSQTILALIFAQTKAILGADLSTSSGDSYTELYDLIPPVPNTSFDSDVWMAPTLPYRIIDCHKLSNHQKLLLLKFCHTIGNNLWIQPSHPCLPIMSYALSKGCNEIVNYLLEWFSQDFKDPHEKFVMVIQQCSVDIFKLFSLKHSYSNEEVFKYTSNALQELHVKQTFISKELQMFLWFKLAKFGFDNFCSNSTVPKSPMEWIRSCQFIIEDVRQLKHRSDRGDFLGIDNEVIFLLRMIHNQLFYIKDKPHFKNLPLKETTFLLSIFLSSFEVGEVVEPYSENCAIYRMVLNKLTLMKFLEFIAQQLNEYLAFFSNLVNRLVGIIKAGGSAPKREKIQSNWKDLCKTDKCIPMLSDNVWNSLFSKKFSSLLNTNTENVVETVLSTEPVVFIPQKRKQFSTRIARLYHRVKQLYSLRKIFRTLQRVSSGGDCNEITVASLKRFNQIFGESIKNTKNSQNLPAKLNRALNYQLRDYIIIVMQTRDVTCHDYPLVKKFFPFDEQYMFYARIKEQQIKMLTATVAMLLICTHSEYWRCLFGSLRQCCNLRRLQSLIRFVGDQRTFESDQVQFLNIVCKYHDELHESLNVVSTSALSTDMLNSLERIKKNHKRRLGTIEKLREAIQDSFSYTFREIQIAAFSCTSVEIVHRLLSVNLLPKSDYNLLEFIENSWVVLDEDLNALTAVSDLFEKNVVMLQSTLLNLEINRESMQEYHRRQEIHSIVDSLSDVLLNDTCDRQKLENDLNSKLDRKKYFNNIFLIQHKMQSIRDVFQPIATSALNDRINALKRKEISERNNIFKGIQQSILNVYEKYDCSSIELLIKNSSHIPQDATVAIEYWLLELCEILITVNQFQDNFHTMKNDLQMICGRNFRNYLAHDGLSYNTLTCSSNLKVLINGLVMATKNWKLFDNPHPSLVTGISEPREMGTLWLKEQKLLIDSDFNMKDMLREGNFSGRFWMAKGTFQGLMPLRPLIVPTNNSSTTMFSTALENGDFRIAVQYLHGQTWNQESIDRYGYPCLGELLKYLNEHGNKSELFCLLSQLKMENIASCFCADSQEFVSHFMNNNTTVLPVRKVQTILLCKPVEHLKKLIPDSAVDCSSIESAVLLNHSEYFKHLLQLPRINQELGESELGRILKLCARFGRLKMVQILTTSCNPSQDSIDLALSVATKHQHWKLVSFLLTEKNANPWNYMNELYAGDLAIRMGNLRLHKKFFEKLSKTEFDIQSLLSKAVECGSVRVAKFLLDKGCDVWQNQKLLLDANSNRKDGLMLDFIEEVLFKFKANDKMDVQLQEWNRVVHERQLLDNFNESSRMFLHSYQRSKKMLKAIMTFGKMDDGCSVEKLESCCIKCNDPRIKTFRSINNVASFHINIQCLAPTGSPTAVKVLLENSTDFIFDVILDVFNAESELPCNLTLSKSYSSNPLPIFICYDLVKLVDVNTSSSAIIGQFQLGTQQIRFICVGTCLYIAHVGTINSPTYLNGYFNTVNRRGHCIFNSLHSDVDIELIKLLLSTGVDLTTVDKSGKNALMLALDALCSWEVLEFMLEYCVRNNIHSAGGIHIFDMQDLKGCTLLQYAILIRRLNVVVFLLDHGVNQETHDNSGMFPIHHAALSGSLLITDTLIDHDKDVVNLPQINNKYTPLMMAVNMNNSQLVQLLLQKGADLSKRNDQGQTAIAWAISMERYSILCQLLNHSNALDIDVLSNITGDQQNALRHTLLQDNEKIFKIVLERMVGGPMESTMARESLISMKNILLARDAEGMNIFDDVALLGRTRISSYLKQCENLYEQIMGAPLRIKDSSWQSDLIEMVRISLSNDMVLTESDDLD